MFGRSWKFLALLAGTVAVPYAVSNSDQLRESAAKVVPALSAHSNETKPTGTAALTPSSADAAEKSSATAAPPQLTDVADMAEVFRLDVSPVWVINRWTRVSTQLAGLDGQGYRVPLVTGSRADDLAGALTYYFTPQRQLKRITFNGTTGDPRRLVWLMNSRFQFQQKITPDAATFTYEANLASNIPSTLEIRPMGIVRSDTPRSRYSIELDIRIDESAPAARQAGSVAPYAPVQPVKS
ncbi:MAG: DUF6690 family protein [Pirellulales bacterium]|nr:hypothetical protein [Planctomycetales bacterium]